jgi:pseudaminic acid cytidylyltransferase
MRSVAIIPARGGSKRIPNKNIKFFCGEPIIAYSIKIARESRLFQRIIVSTDSEKIAKVARQYGAEVPFIRPAKLADDFSTSDDALVHALKFLYTRKQLPKLCCCIYATAPFLQVRYLKKGLDLIRKNPESASFSVARVPFPMRRALRLFSDKRVKLFWPEHEQSRSQDLEEAFYDAGQFYWVHTKSFLRNKTTFPKISYPVIIPRYLAHDLDIPEDWESAEVIYKALYGK